jgi:CheY-like chemotaxis protein
LTTPTRVLVADDNVNFRILLTDLLQHEGYEVEAVIDGDELVRAATDRPPHVILADVRLPGLSAIEALRRLRAAKIETPVVFMTGDADDETLDEAAALGVLFVLQKPFAFEALRDAVRACIDA